MADHELEITATCHCKKHKFTTKVPSSSLPLSAQICHCYQCRHATGNICNQCVKWPGSPESTDISALSKYGFGANTSIHFCDTCGSEIFFNAHASGKDLIVLAGALGKADDLIRFDKHIYVSDTKDGGAADWLPKIRNVQLPRYARHERDKELREPRTVTRDADEVPNTTTAEDEKKTLDLKCLCGGVHATISRPHLLNPKGTEMTEIFWLDTNDRFRALVCTCRDCRAGVGGAFFSLGYVPSACIKQADGGAFDLKAGTLKAYRGSESATRYFCGECGAFAYFVADANLIDHRKSEGLIGVGMGLLCSDRGARADDWFVWRTYKLAFEGSSNHTAFRDGLKEGLRQWGVQRFGEGSPFVDEESMLKISSKMSKAAGVGPIDHKVEQANLVKSDNATA